MTDVAMIGLGVDTGPLTQGERALDSFGRRGDKTQGQISRATDRMVAGFRNVASRVFNLRTAVATLAGSAGIGLLIRSNLEAIDEMAKFADTVGDTTENIQAMRRQAELAGVDLRTMDSALQRATRRAAEAADESGAAADTYDRLGLSAQRVAEMAPTEAFWQQAEAIRNLTSRSEQLRAANQIFGREAEEVIRIIDQGEESFNAIREEMEATGEAISRIDAARVEEANDAITEMRASFGVIGQQLAIQLAPLISGVADRIRGASQEGVNFEDRVGDAIDATVTGISFLVDAVEGVRRTFRLTALAGVQGFIELRRGALEFAQFIDDAVLSRIQDMRHMLRFMPGFTGLVADLALPDFDTDRLEEDLDQSRRMVEMGREEIRQILAEPMPSEGLQEWVRKQREAIAEVNRESGALSMPGIDDGEGEEDEAAERQRRQMERRAEVLRNGLLSEREIEQNQFWERMEELEELREHELLTKREHEELIQAEFADHQQKLTAIERAGMTEREKFQRASLKSQVSQVSGTLEQITAGVAQHNKTMFRMNQAAGIANALINTYQGVTEALAAYPPPISFVMAAAQLAAGMAQVSAIRSASFSGGGGGGSAPSLAGSTPAQPTTPVSSGSGGGAQPTQEIVIDMRGSRSDDESVIGRVIEEIDERVRDGMPIGGIRLARSRR